MDVTLVSELKIGLVVQKWVAVNIVGQNVLTTHYKKIENWLRESILTTYLLHGGATSKISSNNDEFLVNPKLGGLKEKLEGKIYAGSSMGAFLASKGYVLSSDGQDTNTVHEGVGLLPIQTLCHWDVENKKEQKLKLLKKASGLPILALDETKFVKIFG